MVTAVAHPGFDPTDPFVLDNVFARSATAHAGGREPGRRYAARFPDQQPLDGTQIPTLSGPFDQLAASDDDQIRFNIATKLEPDSPGCRDCQRAW